MITFLTVIVVLWLTFAEFGRPFSHKMAEAITMDYCDCCLRNNPWLMVNIAVVGQPSTVRWIPCDKKMYKKVTKNNVKIVIDLYQSGKVSNNFVSIYVTLFSLPWLKLIYTI